MLRKWRRPRIVLHFHFLLDLDENLVSSTARVPKIRSYANDVLLQPSFFHSLGSYALLCLCSCPMQSSPLGFESAQSHRRSARSNPPDWLYSTLLCLHMHQPPLAPKTKCPLALEYLLCPTLQLIECRCLVLRTALQCLGANFASFASRCIAEKRAAISHR